MSVSGVSLLFEGVVAVLLGVMIFYAVKLNRRITGLRNQEAELQGMIAQFNAAVTQADASADKLKSVGGDAERTLRGTIERAQALRDDLMFMIERGSLIADGVESAISATGNGAAATAGSPGGSHAPRRRPDPAPGPPRDNAAGAGPRSDAERELLQALRARKAGR